MDYYKLIIYILFGILPSLLWLFYYLRKDLHPEPKRTILKIFILGALATVPVFCIQLGLSFLLGNLQNSFYYPSIFNIIKWFLVIAFTEELMKYLIVRIFVFNDGVMDEPLDIML